MSRMPHVFLSCSHLEITRGGWSLHRSTRFSILKTYCLRDELGSNRLQEKYGQMSRLLRGRYMVAVGWMLLKTQCSSVELRVPAANTGVSPLHRSAEDWPKGRMTWEDSGSWYQFGHQQEEGPLVALYSLR